MAEIKIKKKAPIWPWVVGALVLALIIYLLVSSDDNIDDVDDVNVDDTEQVIVQDTVVETKVETDEIADYNRYVSDQTMDVNHEYSNTALTKLIAATRAAANELNIDVSSDLSAAETKANEITKDPTSLKHSNEIKDAAQHISSALKKIQNEKFPDLKSQYEDVEKSVSNIKKDVATLDQKDAVRDFFNKAGNLLTSIQNSYGQAR